MFEGFWDRKYFILVINLELYNAECLMIPKLLLKSFHIFNFRTFLDHNGI